MIKTLYVRLVLSFLLIVIISLITSFLITSKLYSTEIVEEFQTQTIQATRDIAYLYEKLGPADFEPFLENSNTLRHYTFLLYNNQGLTFSHGPGLDRTAETLTQDRIRKVLNGGVQLDDTAAGQFRTHNAALLVGVPFQIDGEPYALFMRPHLADQLEQVNQALTTVLLLVLGVGSLLILIASRYLVRPLKAMTAATGRLARGDFDISLPFNRRDELGELATSITRMARELKQLEHMRQEFVSNVSHEIQSPLTSIRGFSKALRDGTIPDAERERYLDIIQTESERLSRLSENLLRLAALEADHHPYHPRPYALDEQLRQVIITTEPQWSDKQLEPELHLQPTTITADQDLLNQVWMNLITNAIRYTPPGGRLTLSLTADPHDPGHITVRLSDTGIGIPPDEQERIFQRFYKVDKSRNRDQSGSGLGLSIVKKIIDLHHGTIHLHSDPGQGTTFTIRLPLHTPRP